MKPNQKTEQKEETKQEITEEINNEWVKEKPYLDEFNVTNLKKGALELKDDKGNVKGYCINVLTFECDDETKNVRFYPSITEETKKELEGEILFVKNRRKPYLSEIRKLFPMYDEVKETIKKKGSIKLQMRVSKVTPPNAESYLQIGYKDLQAIDILN